MGFKDTPMAPLLNFFIASCLCGCLESQKGSETGHAETNLTGRNDAWTVVGAGGGGAMFTPTISPLDPNLVFVSCDMTGTYVTENGGDTWRMLNLRGVTRSYAFDPNNRNVVYANSVGLFQSTDAGKTWAIIYPHPREITGLVSRGDHATEVLVMKDSSHRNVLAFAVDPSDSKNLYAAISIDKELGFFFSNDQGEHWTKEKTLEDGAKKIFVVPSSSAKQRAIYIAGKNTITVKRDGVWYVNKVPDGIRRITDYAGGFDERQNKFLIYAIAGKGYFNREGGPSGIYITEDGGETWQNRQQNLVSFQAEQAGMPEYRAIATSANHPEIIYVSYNNLQTHQDTTCIGVAKSVDYGVTWTLSWRDRIASNHVQLPAVNMEDGWINDRFGPSWGENPFSLGVDPNNPNVCYGTDFGRTIKTEDGGKTWRQVYTKKSKGGGWTSRGLDVTTSYQMAFDPFYPDHRFIATTDVGLMESRDGGQSWSSATYKNGIPPKWENSTYWVVMDPEVKNKMWAAMSGTHDLPRPKMWRQKGVAGFTGGIVLSEDGGSSWRPISADIGEGAVTHLLLDSASDPSSRTLYACAFGKGVFKSTDGGLSWRKKNNGLAGGEPFVWRMEKRTADGTLFLIAARRSEDGTIGTEHDGALYKSSDGAETWSTIALPNGANGPMSLKVDPKNPQTLILSAWGRRASEEFAPDTGGGIFRSANDGKTWEHVLKNDQHIHDITYDARIDVFYACGFNGNAYRSEDSGKSWNRIKGYNFKWGKRVEPDPSTPDKIFIITFGGGVWYGPAAGDPNAVEDIVSSVVAYH
jgi:photosystem II stability/assembly factor-like uncharacterized protein